jgi:hydrogenase maturation protease
LIDRNTARSDTVDLMPPPLVLGLGDLLMGDQGVGLHLLGHLSRESEHWHVKVEFMDGGTRGPALIGPLVERWGVVILDAVSLGAAPGTLHSLSLAEALEIGRRPAAPGHEGSATRLLAIASLAGTMPAFVRVVGIEPGRVELGVGLSERVHAGIPEALEAARSAIAEMLVLAEARRHLEFAIRGVRP